MKFCPRCGQRLMGLHLEEKQRSIPKPEAPLMESSTVKTGQHELGPILHAHGTTMVVDYEKQQQFEPLNKRTQLLLWILVISMVLSIIAIFSNLAQAELINRVISGEDVTLSEAIANDNRQAAIGYGQIALAIASTVVFFMWIYRANKNLRSLRAAGLRFTPGWAVGWFFIPFMNFFRPYQVVSEIWRASNPEVDMADGTSWKAVGTSPFVGFWWALWLTSNFIANIALRLGFSGTTLYDLLNATYASMVSDGISVASLLVTIFMVRGIGQFQEAKNKLVSSTYDKTIEVNPDSADAYYERGDAYAEVGKYGQAIDDYSKAIELAPGHALAYFNRAYAYGEIGEYDKAIADYSKAIELNSSDAQAYYNRGLDYRNKGEMQKAVSDLEKCIALSTDPELMADAQRALNAIRDSP
jgi:tetratricopeptide (TPR) repeat protein